MKLQVKKQLPVIINILLTVVNVALVGQANSIAKANIGFEIDKVSREHASRAFDDIYKNDENKSVIYKLKSGEKVVNRSAMMGVVDTLEEVGSDFCQGTAKARHIRIYLQNTLAVMCNNQEILDSFKGEKNGLAILCTEFFPGSGFATTLTKEEINTCEFVDSSQFPRAQNRKRFEY